MNIRHMFDHLPNRKAVLSLLGKGQLLTYTRSTDDQFSLFLERERPVRAIQIAHAYDKA